mgnify:CR=1 FL=1
MSGSNSKAAALGSAVGPAGLVTGKEEKKKAGGGVLNRLKGRRQAPHHAADDGIGAAVTEQELLALDTIRPEHVLRLSQVTESEYGAGRVLPSASGRRAPGPRVAFRGAGRSRLGGPRGSTQASPTGQASLPTAPPDRVGAPLPHLHLKGMGPLELDCPPLTPATSGFPVARPGWALRPGRPYSSSAGSLWVGTPSLGFLTSSS